MKDVYQYIIDLYEALNKPALDEKKCVARMKKFLNFVGLSVDPDGGFLHEMRRSQSKTELLRYAPLTLLIMGMLKSTLMMSHLMVWLPDPVQSPKKDAICKVKD